MERYALITVDLRTGEPTRYATYRGPDAADRAHARAAKEADPWTRVIVIGLVAE